MEMTVGSYRIAIERIPFTSDELRQRYDYLASEWHHVVERLGFTRAYQRLFQQMEGSGYLARLPERAAVLDCGIGAGDLSLALLESYERPLVVDGIDLSAEMLAQAERRLGKLGNVGRFQQADVQQLPYDDHQFDLVITAHTLEHLADPEAGLREMARVVKPGGLVLIIVTHHSLWGRWIQHRWRIHLLDQPIWIQWMRASGLTPMATYCMSASVWSLKGSIALIGKA